ncbi:nifU-like protein 4, mitochondrial [Dorcoceras hygrometricum]|uniref:NifU-like protein 4, mitochondrial n=1 Tax=Dorcoceras hygrometricum TaxID=472368 RepID=A0A2Z7AS87_9LAMI|nr:nifU-like protein 4, mitochondrial [Dorcoceras hygrometricum]
MKIFERFVRRAILSSSKNGVLLSKPCKSQFSAPPGFYRFRRLLSSSSSCSSDFKSMSSSMRPLQRNYFQGQRRSMFIQTQSTPNPSSLMFYPGKPVMEAGSSDFPNPRSAMSSPLAKTIFGIDGITRVFFGSDFVTVTKSEGISWDILKPQIYAAIMDFYSSGQPLILDLNAAASMDTAISEDDSETVAMIKELLETHTGIVKLKMQGACSGCPSSSVTLKSGIENMLMHYVPEVKGVEQELDPEEEDTALSGAPYE